MSQRARFLVFLIYEWIGIVVAEKHGRFIWIDRKVLGAFLSAQLKGLGEHDDDPDVFGFVKDHMPEVGDVTNLRTLFDTSLDKIGVIQGDAPTNLGGNVPPLLLRHRIHQSYGGCIDEITLPLGNL